MTAIFMAVAFIMLDIVCRKKVYTGANFKTFRGGALKVGQALLAGVRREKLSRDTNKSCLPVEISCKIEYELEYYQPAEEGKMTIVHGFQVQREQEIKELKTHAGVYRHA